MNIWKVFLILSAIILSLITFCILPKQRIAFKKVQVVNKGKGVKKSLYKTSNGTYIKNWLKRHKSRYFLEKKFYTRLKNNPHFPELIRYNDKTLELEIKDVGTPLRDFSKPQLKSLEKQIPNWKQQIKEIILALNQNDLTYNDWHSGNIVYKDQLLKVIDFDTTRVLLVPQMPLESHTSLDMYLSYIYKLYNDRKIFSPPRKKKTQKK